MMVITYLQIQGILHPLYQLQEVPGLEPKVLVLILEVLVDLIVQKVVFDLITPL